MNVPRTMAAAYVNRLGDPAEIDYGELPVPRPGPDEVLINAIGSAVNHVDTFVRSGSFPTPIRFPFVIGRDVAGTVVAVGDRVDQFRVGDRVWCNSMGHGGRQGVAAEYAAAPAERVYPVPPGVDPTTAVAVAHPAATAYLALIAHGGLRSGQTVYIGGGAGQVGSALITIAHQHGARIVASAAEHDREYCLGLGADHVLDYKNSGLFDQLAEWAPGGVGIAIDTSGRQDLSMMLSDIALGGRVVLLAGMGSRVSLDVGSLYTRDRSLIGFVISNATVDQLAAAAAQINGLLAQNTLGAREITRMPLSRAADAHEQMERGRVRSRIVLQP